MTTLDTGALETVEEGPSEDEFFGSIGMAAEPEDNLPIDLLRPSDPVLARKMTQTVRLRRARFGKMVAAVVASGVLLVIAALAHLRVVGEEQPGASAWAEARGFAESHAMVKASTDPELGPAAAPATEAPETSSAL